MPAALTRHRTDEYKPFLAWMCGLTLFWTVLPLYAGGFTTSIRAGMAFLDWPLSNGSINPEGWLVDPAMRAEHSHRLLAATVGLLTLVIAIWLHLRDARAWMRRLGLVAAALVVGQGLLGGMRVRFDWLNTDFEHNTLAQAFAVLHGCAAQVFVCVMVTLALGTTRRWLDHHGGLQREPSRALRRAGFAACAAVFVQLVLGAVMRHAHAGLAISTFPLATEGSLIPESWNFGVGIHFAHRAWALVVTVALVLFAGRLWAARHLGRILGAGGVMLCFLLSVQVYLGALVVWTARNPHAATMHMLCGAFLLASTWGLTFLSHRFRFADAGWKTARPSTREVVPAGRAA